MVSMNMNQYHTLLPIRKMWLDEGCCDGERFFHVFDAAWNKIPGNMQADFLLRLCSLRGTGLELLLTDGWDDSYIVPPSPREDYPDYHPRIWMYSEYLPGNKMITINAECYEKMPDNVVEVMIVQALGQFMAKTTSPFPDERGIIEYLADSWAFTCGFDPFVLDVWDRCHIKSWSVRNGITWHATPRQEPRMQKKLQKTVCGFNNAPKNWRYQNAKGRPIVIDKQDHLNYDNVSQNHRLVTEPYFIYGK